jgi:plastocyanin
LRQEPALVVARSPLRRWLVSGLFLVSSSLSGIERPAAAEAGRARLETMSRELRQLRTEVQALRAILGEIAELDRQRSILLSRALGTPEAGTGLARREPARTAAASSSAPSPARDIDIAPPSPNPAAPSLEAGPPVAANAPGAASGGGRVSQPTAPVVHRRPPPPPEVVVGEIRGKVAVPPGEPVAYVYVENVDEPAVHGKRVAIQQVGKKFVPAWAVVQRGTSIEFPNLDNIYHNVFSLSSGNSFDLGLYNSSADAKAHTFNEPGAVDIYCNIHPQMAASALVVPNRHFAKVRPDGGFEIKGVPRGKRKVVAWAPGARLTSQWVELDGETSEVSLKLEPKTLSHTNKQGHPYGSYE